MPDLLLTTGVLVIFATLAGLIANRLRLPPVLGLLAVGAFIGPNVLGWVEQNSVVVSFADIGAILLLFTIGFEFSLSKLFAFGKRSFFIALVKLAIIFFLTYELASLAGLDATSSAAIGAIIAITSTALMIKIIEQRGLKDREEIPLLLGTLVIEDVFAVFALTMISSLGSSAIGPIAVFGKIVWAIALISSAYFALFLALNKVFDWITTYQAKETMIFLALSIGIGLSYLAQYLGLTPSIGAFLAGSLVASMPRAKILEESIVPFSLAFSSIFFVSIGMLINLHSVWANIWLVALLCIANIVFKFAGTATSTYLFGFNGRQAAFAGVAMLSVGEFSLLIAKEAQASSSIDLLGITSALVFTSVLATSIFASRGNEAYVFSSRLLPLKAKRIGRDSAAAMQDLTNILEHSKKATDLLGKNVFVGIGLAALLLLVGRTAIAAWSGVAIARLYGFIVTTEWVVAAGLLIAGFLILKAISRAFSQVGHRYGYSVPGHKLAEWEIRRAKTIAKVLAVVIATPFLLSLFNSTPIVRQLAVVAVIGIAVYFFATGGNAGSNETESEGERGGRVAFFKRER